MEDIWTMPELGAEKTAFGTDYIQFSRKAAPLDLVALRHILANNFKSTSIAHMAFDL